MRCEGQSGAVSAGGRHQLRTQALFPVPSLSRRRLEGCVTDARIRPVPVCPLQVTSRCPGCCQTLSHRIVTSRHCDARWPGEPTGLLEVTQPRVVTLSRPPCVPFLLDRTRLPVVPIWV